MMLENERLKKSKRGQGFMEISIPYQDNYKKLKLCRKLNFGLLVFVIVLSVILPILRKCNFSFYDILDFLNIVLIIGYFVLTTVTEVFIYQSTSLKRRMGYIDNSIGSKLLEKPLMGYFSNDSIPYGPYKLAVNCYENCYFSYNIAKAMTLRIVIKNSVFFIFFLACAYFGFQGNVVATPIIQIFISTLFLNELIQHLNFRTQLKKILDSFQQLFSQKFKHDDLGMPIFLALDYETVLAFNKSPLSDKIYNQLNPKLSE